MRYLTMAMRRALPNAAKQLFINPLLPSAYKSARIDKISILKLKAIIKKISMSVATMSR